MIEGQEPSGSPFEDNIEDGPKDTLVSQQPEVTVEHREAPADDQPVEMVHLPALLSDEFGISQSVARDQIMLGMVEIDDVEVEQRDKFDYTVAELDGKTIAVIGRDRQFRMSYDHDHHLRRRESFR